MVNAEKGVLVECDSQMKQFLLHLDSTEALGGRFILQDLDPTHLFLETAFIERLRDQIDDLMDKTNFVQL